MFFAMVVVLNIGLIGMFVETVTLSWIGIAMCHDSVVKVVKKRMSYFFVFTVAD